MGGRNYFMNGWIMRALCIILSVCLLVPDFLPVSLYAGVLSAEYADAVQAAQPLEIQNIQVPPEIGSVQEFYRGKVPRVVFLVQDAHAIPDAQGHIRDLIRYFRNTYGVEQVALEGASDRLDPKILRSFPDPKTLNAVLAEFQSQGHLPGSVAAAILEDPKISYWGIEDWGLYEEGIGYYLEALKRQTEISDRLSGIREKLDKEKERKYSGKLLEIDRLLESFEANKASLPEVLKKLSEVKMPPKGSELALIFQESEKRTGDEGRRSEKDAAEIYTEVRRVAEAVKKAVDTQREAAAKNKAQLPARSPGASAMGDHKSFTQKYQQFQTSQISPEAFALFLKQIAAENKLPIKVSKNLAAAVRRQKRMQDIRGTKLFVDFETYSEEVKKTLFATDEQRSLNARARRLRLLEKLNQLELTYEEWGALKKGKSQKEKGESKRGRRSSVQKKTLSGLGPVDKGRSTAFAAHLAFYKNAEKRDRTLFDRLIRLLEKEPLLTPDDALQTPVVAVAGGFHTEGLTKKLRQSGVSYVLIAPRIDVLPEKTAYRDQMRGEVPWRRYFRVRDGRVGVYDAFVRGVRDRLLEKAEASYKMQDTIQSDDRKGPASAGLLRFWRDEILRGLASENRLSEAGKYTQFLDEAAAGNNALRDFRARQLKADAERFVEALRRLNAEGQMNERNILKILGANAAISWSAGTAVAQPGSRIQIPEMIAEIATAEIAGTGPFADPSLEFAPGRAELRADENPPVVGTPSDRIGRMMSGAREILRRQNPEDRYLTGTFFDTLNWCFSWGHLNSVTSERFANQIETFYRMFDHAMSSPEHFVEVRALHQDGIPYAEFYVVADVSQGSSTDLENLIAAEISKKNTYKLTHHLRTIPSPYSAGQKFMVAVFEVNLENKNSWATPAKAEAPGKIAEMKTRVDQIREALVEAIGEKLSSIPNEEVYAGTWTSSAADIKKGTAVVLEEPAADMNVVADNLYASLRVSDPVRMTAEKNRLLQEDLETFDRRVQQVLDDLQRLPKVFESITVDESDLEKIAAYIRDLADQTRQIATKPRPQLTRYRQTAASIFTHLVLTQINEKRLYGQNAGELTPEQMIYAEKIVFAKRIFLDSSLYASEGLQAQAVAREKAKFQEAVRTQSGQTTFSGAAGFQAIVDLMVAQVESEIENGVPAKYAILNRVPPILDQLKSQERIAVELDSMVRGILDELVRLEFVPEGGEIDLSDAASRPSYPGEIILFANNLYQARLEKILENYPNITTIVVMGRRAVGHWLFAARARGIRVFRMEDDSDFDPADPRLNGKNVILVSHKEIAGQLENRLIIQPSAGTKEKYQPYLDAGESYEKVALALSGEPAVSQDGIEVDFAANADSPETISEAVALGADGARLVRTEYLFDQNVEALRIYLEAYERYQGARSTGENVKKMKAALAEATEGLVAYFADRFYEMGVSAQEGIVNIRAYDHQPDKQEKSQLRGKMKDRSGHMIYGPACYMTPLGQRLLKIQIEAVFRANYRNGSSRLQLMFPTSRSPRELLEFLGRKDWKGFDSRGEEQSRLDDLARKDLRLMKNLYRVVRRRTLRALETESQAGKGRLFSPELQWDGARRTKLGYMIESLEWVRILEEVLKESEFISLGTNDLTQSIFREKGISRDNPEDAPYFEQLRPEVLEKLLEIFDRAERFNTLRAGESPEAEMISVSICGDLASFEQFQPFIPYALWKLAAGKPLTQEGPAGAAIVQLNLPIHLSVTAMDIPKLKQVVRGLKTEMTVFFDRMKEKGFVLDDAARALVRQIENAHKSSDSYREILAQIEASSAAVVPPSRTPPVEYSLEDDLRLARAEEALRAAQAGVQKVWDEMPKVGPAATVGAELPVTLEQTFRVPSAGLHSLPATVLVTRWKKIRDAADNPGALEASVVNPDGSLRKIHDRAVTELLAPKIEAFSSVTIRVTGPESVARAYFDALRNVREEWTDEKMYSETFAEADLEIRENLSYEKLSAWLQEYPEAEVYAQGTDPYAPANLKNPDNYPVNAPAWEAGKTIKIFIGEKAQEDEAEKPARVKEALEALGQLPVFGAVDILRNVPEPQIQVRSEMRAGETFAVERDKRVIQDMLRQIFAYAGVSDIAELITRAQAQTAGDIIRYQLAALGVPSSAISEQAVFNDLRLFAGLVFGAGPLGFIRYMAWRAAAYLEERGRFKSLQSLLFRLAYSQKIVQADVANLLRPEKVSGAHAVAVTEALIPVPVPHFQPEMRQPETGVPEFARTLQSVFDRCRRWLKAFSVRFQSREDLKYFDRLAGEVEMPKAIASNLRDVISRFSHPLGRYEVKLLTWLATGPKLPSDLKADQVLWAVRDLAGTPGLEDVLRNVPFGGTTSKTVTGQIGFLSEIMFAYRLKQTGYDILAMGQTFEPNVEVDIFVMDRKTRETFLAEAKNVRSAGLKKGGDRVARWLSNVVGPKIPKYQNALRELNRSSQVWDDARESLNIPADHPAKVPEKFFVVVSASVARLTTGQFHDGIGEADLERLFQRENFPVVKVLSVSQPESEQTRKIARRFPGFDLSPSRREILTPLPNEKKPAVVGTKTGKEQIYRQHALAVNRFMRDMLRVYSGLDVKLNVVSQLPDHLEDAAQDGSYAKSKVNLEKILEQNDHSGLMTRTWLAGLTRELPGTDHLWHRFLVGAWLRDGILPAVESPESPGVPATDQETLSAWKAQFAGWAKSQKPRDNAEFLEWKGRQDRMNRAEMRMDRAAAKAVLERINPHPVRLDEVIRRAYESFKGTRKGRIFDPDDGKFYAYDLSLLTKEMRENRETSDVLRFWQDQTGRIFREWQAGRAVSGESDFRVLEIGSADGTLAGELDAALSPMKADGEQYGILGIDFDPIFVKTAAGNYRAVADRVGFRQGDATDLRGIADNSQNIVALNEGLGNLPLLESQASEKSQREGGRRVEPVFREFYRVLKPGGYFILHDYEEENSGEITQLAGYLNYPVEVRLAALVDAGFEITDQGTFNSRTHFIVARKSAATRQEMRLDFDQMTTVLQEKLSAVAVEGGNAPSLEPLGVEDGRREEGLSVEPAVNPKEKLLDALKTRYGGIVLATAAGELLHLTFRGGVIYQRKMAFGEEGLAYAEPRAHEWADSVLSEDFRLFEIPQRQMPWPLDPDLEVRIRKFIADSNQKAKDRKILMEQGGAPKKEFLKPDVDSDVENEFFDRLKTILPKLDDRYRVEGILGWGTEVAVYEMTDQISGKKARLALKVAGGIGAIPEMPSIAESMLEAQIGNVKAIESLIRENPDRLSHIAVPAVFEEIRMDEGVRDSGLIGIIVEFVDFQSVKILGELGDPAIPVHEREQTYQAIKVLIDLLLEQKRIKLLDLQSDVILKKPDGKYLLSDAGIMPPLAEGEDVEEVRHMLCNVLRAKLSLDPVPDEAGSARAELREDKSPSGQVKEAGAKAGMLLVEFFEGRDAAKAGELAKITIEVSPEEFQVFIRELARSAENAAEAAASNREKETAAGKMNAELYAAAAQLVLAKFSGMIAEILKNSPEKSGAVFAVEIPVARHEIDSRSFAAILKAALSAFGTEKVRALVPVTPPDSKLTGDILKALADAGVSGEKLETQIRKASDLDGIGARRDSPVCLMKNGSDPLQGKFSGIAVGVDREGYADSGYNFQDQILRMVAQMTIGLAAVSVLNPRQIEALNRVRQSPGGREKLTAAESKEIKEALSRVLLKQETILGLQSIDDLINGIESGNLSFVMKTIQTMIASVKGEAAAKTSA
jgi:phosphoenolpyruvate-protein kinase (PTS system EI component)/SAM-dependent methyltransferase